MKAILALAGLRKKDVALLTGYSETYVRQVLGGFVKPSRAFRDELWEVVDKAIFGKPSISSAKESLSARL